MKWQRVRDETPVTHRYAYFDTAAAAPPVRSAVQAMTDYLAKTVDSGPYLPSLRAEIYRKIEDIRGKTARFIGAEPEEIAFTRNGTESISLIGRGIVWRAGDELILPDTEMLSNVAIWRQLESEIGIRIVTVRADEHGLIDPTSVANAISERTRLISFVSLSNVTGAVQPVAQICQVARKAGVLTHVDAAQSLGMIPTDINQIGCDFLSACTRKGLRSVEGSGILYVRQEHISNLSPVLAGWWNASIGEDGGIGFPDTARRFEAGSPNVPVILALEKAIDYAENIGVADIEAHVRELTEYAVTKIRSIDGASVYGPPDSTHRLGIIPFNVAGIDPAELVAALAEQGIIIESGHFMATPILKAYGIETMARASLHYFNSQTEIDRMTSIIKSFLEKERGRH
ncbi:MULTISPECIES: aminotransferase class V-fold PLP-dependent enzyme [Micrococcaceae]|uniref:aminotransferase class V-fold PLP-dependent enzyme n=1 Tax=unclassified Kocuria TaxID=2649579 RepID=UPI001012DFB9|nr:MULTISPECIES: aminotransferase class V-fold PLP-dependent enzyme [unclassified Kocuria]